MMHTEERYEADRGKIVIFGAGRIGRSFIGQLFARGGYRVVFIDIDRKLTDLMNQRGGYRIIIRGDKDEEILVRGISAIHLSDREKIAATIASAELMAVSVGKNSLGKSVPYIAEGLKRRYASGDTRPLDIILAENMRDAGEFVRELLNNEMPADYPLDRLVGLIETSIGKMVPIMTQAELEKDPLLLFAEPYNTLIVDKNAFRSEIPDIEGLAPKENMKAWVDRKAFIHNLGHATAAYYGYYLRPEATYMFEVLDNPVVLGFTRDVMLQSADVLLASYPGEFTLKELTDHIDDLISRFRNKSLRDTLFRVGHDLQRKLSVDDRFMGAVMLAIQCSKPYDLIIRAMSYGLVFAAADDNGKLFGPDVLFMESLHRGFESALTEYLDFHTVDHTDVIRILKMHFTQFSAHWPGYSSRL